MPVPPVRALLKKTYTVKTIVRIPSHMILTLEGFEMPIADKGRKANKDIRRLDNDTYEPLPLASNCRKIIYAKSAKRLRNACETLRNGVK